MKYGQTIILESTSYPGTTEEIIIQNLDSKYKVGKNIFIGFSSERINPGFNENSINKIPKVISGFSNNCKNVIKLFYSKFFDTVVLAKTLKIAEFSKLLENIYRSVNISFMNEMKLVADKMKIDIFEIIKIACFTAARFKFHRGLTGWDIGWTETPWRCRQANGSPRASRTGQCRCHRMVSRLCC